MIKIKEIANGKVSFHFIDTKHIVKYTIETGGIGTGYEVMAVTRDGYVYHLAYFDDYEKAEELIRQIVLRLVIESIIDIEQLRENLELRC